MDKIITSGEKWSADDILKNYNCLGIPHFQRGLVWGHDSVSLLLESLYMGTPCGIFIFWQPEKPSDEGISLSGTDHQVHYLIIDGQQRIRSVHMALSGKDVQGGEDENGKENTADDHRVWCLNLARVPELSAIDEDLRKQEGYALFRYIQDPKSENAQFKHNVIPLQLFFEDRDAEINSLISAENWTDDLIRSINKIKEKVKKLKTNKLFSVDVLEQEGITYCLADVVSLYNRINSGGKRVESEEVAFASLVALDPGTGDWLRDVFAEIHPLKNGKLDEMAIHDDVLKRKKERNFGFKLIIRTFIQVCAYHFNYSLGSNALSFDVVESQRFRRDIIRELKNIKKLQKVTKEILIFVRKTIRDNLYCDDLQMLPDTTSLLPIFQVLIRFPDLMNADNGKEIIGFLILRLLLMPRLNQRMALDLVDLVNKCREASECILRLSKKLGSEINLGNLRRELKESNAIQDRYTLLLYWLIRKNVAKDFSYSQLPKDRRDKMLEQYGSEYQNEVIISERVYPEKQHIVPYKVLADLYQIEARGQISRHIANNIGNITYISRALNHFETGLGSDPVCLRIEPKENLKHHLLGHNLFRDFNMAITEDSKGKRQKAAFERFCKARREMITRGFAEWVKKTQKDARIMKRIEPGPRLFQQDDDIIRNMNLPNTLEDALINCVITGRVKRNVEKSDKHNGCVLVVQDQNRKIELEILLCNDSLCIKIFLKKKPLFKKMQKWMLKAGNSLLESPEVVDGKTKGCWVLCAEPDRSFGTVEVFGKLAEYLSKR